MPESGKIRFLLVKRGQRDLCGAYACFPVPKTTISLGLCRRTIRREDASAVLKAVSSSAFMKPVGRPSLSINVREPRGVGFLGFGASGSLLRGSAHLGAPRVTTDSWLVSNL